MRRNMSLLRRLTSVAAIAVLAITLAGCGSSGSGSQAAGGTTSTAPAHPKQLFADDFQPVCEGATVSAAKAYDKTATTGHKAVYLETYKDGNLVDSSSELPDDWTVQFTATGNAYAAIDVVVCGKRTAQKFAESCDGYTVDNKPDALVVKMYTATYTLTAYEATTGKKLGTKVVAASDGTCPMSEFSVAAGTKTMNDYATPPSEQIVAFAKAFVQP
jgi:hypothetical protein